MAPGRIARPGPRWIVRGLGLGGLALVELLLLLWLVTVLVLVLVGIGVYLVPSAIAAARALARRQRALAGAWSGITVVAPLVPVAPPGRGFRRAWRMTVASVRDPGTWRELLWLVVDPVVGLTLAWLPAMILVYGLWGVVLDILWAPVFHGVDDDWYLFVPLRGASSAAEAAGLGIVLVLIAPWIARPLVRLHARWVRAMLGTGYGPLAERAAQLERSRSDAVDQAWSEIRRIERDLHDGAQARLVAVGMTLTVAERTLRDDDPAATLELIREAKASSVAALAELRDLVRGVFPPVLADRGLVDALRATALGMPVPTTLRTSLDARLAPPVESAVYFAVSELLTNVTKHAHATNVQVDLDATGDVLRVRVRDDGTGGAAPGSGTGIPGIARRLAVFDGTVEIDSPPGGPTVATVLVPWVRSLAALD